MWSFSPPLLGMWAQLMAGLLCPRWKSLRSWDPLIVGGRSPPFSQGPAPDLPWLAAIWCHLDVGGGGGLNPLGWRGWGPTEAAWSGYYAPGTAAATYMHCLRWTSSNTTPPTWSPGCSGSNSQVSRLGSGVPGHHTRVLGWRAAVSHILFSLFWWCPRQRIWVSTRLNILNLKLFLFWNNFNITEKLWECQRTPLT